YFRMHNDFVKGAEPLYTWKGRTVDNKEKIQLLDHNLSEGKSTRLSVSVNKDGSLRKSSSILTEQQLDSQVRYAESLIASAGRNMRDGYIAVSPGHGACDYCDYRNICDYTDVYNYQQRDTKLKVDAAKIEE